MGWFSDIGHSLEGFIMDAAPYAPAIASAFMGMPEVGAAMTAEGAATDVMMTEMAGGGGEAAGMAAGATDAAGLASSMGGDIGTFAGIMGSSGAGAGTNAVLGGGGGGVSWYDKLSSIFKGGAGSGAMGIAKMFAGLYGLQQSRQLRNMATQPNRLGEQAVQRSMASQGYQGSGNMAAALNQLGTGQGIAQAQAGMGGLVGELSSLGLLTSGAFGSGGSSQGGLEALMSLGG